MQKLSMSVLYNDGLKNKKSENTISGMFNDIAPRYDFINHFLSMGIDKLWRKKVLKELIPLQPKKIIDIATGTADLAIYLTKLNPIEITGIDISEKMLEIGRIKVEDHGFSKIINLLNISALNISFPDNFFDAATCAFGVRNFSDLNKGLSEIQRVLKPGAKIVILEFSKPKYLIIRLLFNLYFFKILPFLGKLISKNNYAYTYLTISVDKFINGKDFCIVLESIGFKDVSYQSLSFGICNLYSGNKK